jgi:hypothetical protein
VEIDLSKAYTAAFGKITAIPVFNEFDVFRPYKGEPLEDLSLHRERQSGRPSVFQQV